MSYILLADITATNNSNVVNVHSSENISAVLENDELQLKGELPILIASTDNDARTITLKSNWDESTQANVKAQIRPTANNFRAATDSLKSTQQLATQSLQHMHTLTQTVGSVTFNVPGTGDVTVDSIPKITRDATAAGTTLKQNAESAIALMGNAPALAQQVATAKATVLQYKTTVATDKSAVAQMKTDVTALKNTVLQYKTTVATDKSAVAQMKTDVTALKNTVTQSAVKVGTDKSAVAQMKTDTQQFRNEAEQFKRDAEGFSKTALPAQSNNANKTLVTNGTSASWQFPNVPNRTETNSASNTFELIAGDYVIVTAATADISATMPALTGNEPFRMKNSARSKFKLIFKNDGVEVLAPNGYVYAKGETIELNPGQEIGVLIGTDITKSEGF